jgi:hypothetical protein
MKAYVYIEEHSRTAFSENPTYYYIMDFSFFSSIVGGVSQISTTDYNKFTRALKEQESKGVKMIYERPPIFKKSVEEVVSKPSDDGSPGFKASIWRFPLSRLLAA